VVAKLIDGVLRMAAISASLSPRQSMVLGTQGQVENLRKMLVAMVDDVRVALIKLAERTCAIRAVKTADDEKRNRVAREVFDLRAARPPPGHRPYQVGTGGLVLPLPRARPVQTDRHVAA
jgi:GTP pyrophosphokinase